MNANLESPELPKLYTVADVALAAGVCIHTVRRAIKAGRIRAVEHGRGFRLTHDEAVKFLTGGRPSMLQDVMKGRRTEIDYLNGYVSQQGKRLGVPTPVNDAVVAAVRQHGVGTLKPDPKNLEPLVAALPR